jgi:ABC-2 type transport system permease protein
MERYRSPETVIGRFVARRTVRSAAFVALIFGAYVASKAITYANAFPTVKSRLAIATSFSNNIGLKALLGAPRQLETVSGYAAWNTFIVMVMIGAIWAYLIATRLFRGEEDAGRWEIMLSGQTTPRRAAANVLAGLSLSLGVLFVVSAATFVAIGNIENVGFATTPALYFALCTTLAAVLFAAIGAFASQLMPTRARAASLCTALFGIFFLLRAGGDITSYHWLLYLSPLGWIELLQPLTGSQPLWILPILGLTAVLAAGTIVLAGNRDLGESIIPDKDTSRPHLLLLGGPLTSSLRFTRTATISWLVAIVFVAGFFALLTKTAAQALSDSLAGQHIFSRLTQSSQQTFGSLAFLGIVFFFLMTVLMCYAANAVSSMREDEAQGYLDNLLVRPIGRLRWLTGRATIATIVIIIGSLLTSIVCWLSVVALKLDISWHTLLMAGLNIVAPAVLILGIGIFAMGLLPRFTSLVTYGIIGWSFLMQMVSSGVTINHWLLDLSVFYHTSFAPATDPNWGANAIMIIIGFALATVGALIFNRRDLATE